MEFAPGGARRSGTCWPVRLMPGISPASRPSCTEVHASDRRKTISIVYKISHEATVRRFYDAPEKGGEGAGQAYLHLMGDIWHHGDPGAEASGMPPPEAAYVLERRLMALAGFGANDYVMDFGSGAGGETCNMAEITGGRFVGVSNSESLTALARAHAAERGLDDRVEFRTIGDLDYQRMTAWPDGSLDGVTWYESVCHLPDKQAFFDSMFRVIKPGGTLAGLDWLQRPFGEFQEPEQIARWITPMCAAIRLPSLGTRRLQRHDVAGRLHRQPRGRPVRRGQVLGIDAARGPREMACLRRRPRWRPVPRGKAGTGRLPRSRGVHSGLLGCPADRQRTRPN